MSLVRIGYYRIIKNVTDHRVAIKNIPVISGTLNNLLMKSSIQSQKTKEDLESFLSNGKWIDLTYSFSSETVYWPSVTNTFHLDTVSYGKTSGGFFYSAYAYSAPEHGGTHLDAPIHFAEGKWTTDEIPLDRLAGNAVVIDLSK